MCLQAAFTAEITVCHLVIPFTLQTGRLLSDTRHRKKYNNNVRKSSYIIFFDSYCS